MICYIKIVVDSMHERKTEMAKRVGAFVGLPGGYGTFEEVHEASSLNLAHTHPILPLDSRSYNLEPNQRPQQT